MSTDLVEHWRFRHKPTGQVVETNSESNRDAARADTDWQEEPCRDAEDCIFLDSWLGPVTGT
jgi:hypothetical protein